MTVGIEYQHATVAFGFGCAIGAWRAADDNPATFKHRHGSGQPDSAGTILQVLWHLGKELGLFGTGTVIDDRSAGALKIGNIIEIIDQDIVFFDHAATDRRHHDCVWIEVAIIGNGRGQGLVLVDGFEKTSWLSCCGHRACRADADEHRYADGPVTHRLKRLLTSL